MSRLRSTELIVTSVIPEINRKKQRIVGGSEIFRSHVNDGKNLEEKHVRRTAFSETSLRKNKVRIVSYNTRDDSDFIRRAIMTYLKEKKHQHNTVRSAVTHQPKINASRPIYLSLLKFKHFDYKMDFLRTYHII